MLPEKPWRIYKMNHRFLTKENPRWSCRGSNFLGIQKFCANSWRSKNEGDREILIGNLIIHSIYDGLIVQLCDFDKNRLDNYLWKATKIS